MNVENYYDTIRLINGRMFSNPKVKFIIAKNGNKMVMLTDKMDFYKKIALIKKELL